MWYYAARELNVLQGPKSAFWCKCTTITIKHVLLPITLTIEHYKVKCLLQMCTSSYVSKKGNAWKVTEWVKQLQAHFFMVEIVQQLSLLHIDFSSSASAHDDGKRAIKSKLTSEKTRRRRGSFFKACGSTFKSDWKINPTKLVKWLNLVSWGLAKEKKPARKDLFSRQEKSALMFQTLLRRTK